MGAQSKARGHNHQKYKKEEMKSTTQEVEIEMNEAVHDVFGTIETHERVN